MLLHLFPEPLVIQFTGEVERFQWLVRWRQKVMSSKMADKTGNGPSASVTMGNSPFTTYGHHKAPIGCGVIKMIFKSFLLAYLVLYSLLN